MIEKIKTWYGALSNREKIMVGVLLILLAGTMLFYGLIKPVTAAMSSAEYRYEQAIERQARIESKVAYFSPTDRKDDAATVTIKKINGPIDNFISQSAGEAGFAIGKISLQTDDSVRMTIDSAKPTALFRWLAVLEQRGIGTITISTTPGQNETISATLLLRQTN